jgi:hypothetical protein
MRNLPGLPPNSTTSSGAGDHEPGGENDGSLIGAGTFAAAIADAAFSAVRMLRWAIRNSRDHFIVGQHPCRSCRYKGLAASQQKTLDPQKIRSRTDHLTAMTDRRLLIAAPGGLMGQIGLIVSA